MSIKYADYILREIRLVILRVLNETPARRGNSSTLRTALSAWGFDLTRTEVKEQLRWLEARELLRIEVIGDGSVLLAQLTESGIDLASGRGTVPGVKRLGD
ncbi:TPA: ArsR family transcriptional regulator [Citrobacter farmeri]